MPPEHPNVVRGLDAGINAEDRPWLAMPLFDGSLADALEGLAAERVVPIAVDLLTGLAAIHSAGQVHGNLRPSNVLLTADRAAVADPGTPSGAPARRFLAPELAADGAPTARTDVFAAARTIEALFGADLPAWADHVLTRATSHAPGDRPADADALLDQLRAAAPGAMRSNLAAPVPRPLPGTSTGRSTLPARPIDLAVAVPPRPRRRAVVRFGAGLVVLVGALSLAASASPIGGAPAIAPDAVSAAPVPYLVRDGVVFVRPTTRTVSAPIRVAGGELYPDAARAFVVHYPRHGIAADATLSIVRAGAAAPTTISLGRGVGAPMFTKPPSATVAYVSCAKCHRIIGIRLRDGHRYRAYPSPPHHPRIESIVAGANGRTLFVLVHDTSGGTSSADSVFALDVVTRTYDLEAARVGVVPAGSALSLSSDGRRIVVATGTATSTASNGVGRRGIAVVDTTDLAVRGFAADVTTGLVAAPAGPDVFGLSADGRGQCVLDRIDARTGHSARSGSLPSLCPRIPTSAWLTVSPDASRVYVVGTGSDGSGVLTVLDAADLTVARAVDHLPAPTAAATLSSNGRHLLVPSLPSLPSGGAPQVTELDAATLAAEGTIRLG